MPGVLCSRTLGCALSVLALMSIPQAGQQPPRNVGTGSVAGRVVDRNNEQTPIAGARVTLWRDQGSPIRETFTDQAGRYAFPQIPAGTYRINAYSPGWLATSFGQKKPNRDGVPVAIIEKQSLDDLTIRMFHGAVISGRISGQTGVPLARAVVQVFRLRYSDVGRFLEQIGQADTDDRGQYRVFDLAPGEYLVRVSADTGGRSGISDPALDVQPRPALSYVSTFYPASIAPGQATIVGLTEGEEHSGVDFNLPLVHLTRITGTLIGQTGPATNVAFGRIFDDGLFRYSEFVESQVFPDGRFVLTGLPPAPLTLVVRLAPPRGRPEIAGSPVASTLWAVTRRVIGEQDLTDVTIQLQPGARISGSVRSADSSVPLDSLPEGAMVGLRPVGSVMPAGDISGPIDRQGRFSIADVPPGSYFVSPYGIGPLWSVASIVHQGRDRTVSPIEIQNGDVSDVVVTVTNKPASLKGTLQVQAGDLATNYTAVVFPADSVSRQRAFQGVYAAPVNTAGSFTVNNVFAGQYLVAVTNDIERNAWYDPRVLDQLEKGAVKVTIAPGEAKLLTLSVAANK